MCHRIYWTPNNKVRRNFINFKPKKSQKFDQYFTSELVEEKSIYLCCPALLMPLNPCKSIANLQRARKQINHAEDINSSEGIWVLSFIVYKCCANLQRARKQINRVCDFFPEENKEGEIVSGLMTFLG